MEISINSKLAKGDMIWLEQQFETRGFSLQMASMSLNCHAADFQSAFPQASNALFCSGPSSSANLADVTMTLEIQHGLTVISLFAASDQACQYAFSALSVCVPASWVLPAQCSSIKLQQSKIHALA